jgi:BirA family biotin operon repressor/biotin-[acetyl-CoA-carboxylase] ligase
MFSKENIFKDWDLQSSDSSMPLNCMLFDSLPSTNLYAKENISKLNLPSLIVANHQTGGYGRFQREWLSPPDKNLYFTLLFKPDIPLENFAGLTQITAITLASLLKKEGIDIQLKWPNDLLWKKHKICGILAEMIPHNGQHIFILGIGLNVNSTNSDFQSLDRRASSLREITDQQWNREILLQKFLNSWFLALDSYKKFGFAPFLEEWRSMENFQGSSARLVFPDRKEELWGTIEGINDDGTLLFRHQNGETQSVYSGDLEV